MEDILVTLLFLPLPEGRRMALIGGGGGASVLITDEFEKKGLKVPSLPSEIKKRILEFTPAAGNILRNPVDYSQTMAEPGKLAKTVGIIANWDGIDFLIGFMRPTLAAASIRGRMAEMIDEILEGSRQGSKPVGLVIEPSTLEREAKEIFPIIQKCVSLGLPVYYSFAGAASAIGTVLSHYERHQGAARV
jgi:acyl-CoA synthetase (NDP forming)